MSGWLPATEKILESIGKEFDPDDLFDVPGALRDRLSVTNVDTFRTLVRVATVGDVWITSLAISPHRLLKSTTETDPTHSAYLSFVLSGEVVTDSGDYGAGLRSLGMPYVSRSADSHTSEARTSSRQISIGLPRAKLEARGIVLGDDLARLEGAEQLGPALVSFATGLTQSTTSFTATSGALAGRVLEDLVVGIFLEGRGYAMDGSEVRAGLHARALQIIRVDHRNAHLNSALIANKLRVSVRQLQRAFHESEDDSVSGVLRTHRARTAADCLADPRMPKMRLTDLATYAGFTTVYELRAAFKANYGMLPSKHVRGRPLPLN